MKTKYKSRLLLVLMVTALIFLMSFSALAATTEQPLLVVTGTELVQGAAVGDLTKNIVNEKAYTLAELKSLGVTEEAIYSAINTYANTSLFKGQGVNTAKLLALSGYTVPGKIAVIANDGYRAELDLSVKRFYFPGFVTGDKAQAVEVPAILAWATAGKKGVTAVPSELIQDTALMLMAGQSEVTEQNNPLYNKGVEKLLVGSDLPAVLTVDGKAYSRAQILLMARTSDTYIYTNAAGEAKDLVRGVLLADLLKGVADNAVLSFTAADGYDISAMSLSLSEAKAKNYLLAYEKYENNKWVGIYESGKKSGHGYFTLYGQDLKPVKMISSIAVGAGQAIIPPSVGEWYDGAVAYVKENGLMQGTDKGFAPELTADRATVVTILARMSGEDFTGKYKNIYYDVDPHSWFADAVAWGTEKGIVKGYGMHLFYPADKITREQICVAFNNYLQAYELNLPANLNLVQFTDKAATSDWARSAVEIMSGAGIITGYPDGSFKPAAVASRAEIATLFMRLQKALASIGAEQPVLLVTGKGIAGLDAGIVNEKAYTLEELKNLGLTVSQLYSAMNSSATKSVFLAEGVNMDKLLVALGYDGKANISVVAADGFVSKVNFAEKRYYYPDFVKNSTASAVVVPATIAWAVGGEKGKTEIPSAVKELSSLRLLIGQLNLEDKNNSGFTDGIVKLQIGEELGACITIAGKEYTRASLLMLPRTAGSYTYMTKGGEMTANVRGVQLTTLLKDYADEDIISFTAADGYDMSAATITVKQARAGHYLLAYEEANADGAYKGIFSKAKSGDAVGFFTLYADGKKPASLINGISVQKKSGIDYATSPYRHITNGGLIGSSPYNIDAITGSTLTVEGPGMQKSVPLSIRELENQNSGTVRSAYTDKNGSMLYEGIDLYYILNGMTAGDNGIVTTKNAYKVIIKNRNRANIASFTLAQVKEAHDNGKPILVAYGTGLKDGSKSAPFVFDDALGSFPQLFNEDGCIKLVYDSSSFAKDSNKGYDKFLSMAYIYVCEENTPGFKHAVTPYNSPELTQYILSFCGTGIGREVNLTVEQIEALVAYDAAGNLSKGGLGYRDLYSLTNTSYWYVNEYEGVKLFDLLTKYIGLKGANVTDATKVSFTASDGYKSADSFTLGELGNPAAFGYYEKNAADMSDGKYVSVPSDLLRSGFPVLLCYGVNGYPYTQNTAADGYLSGLSNNGGPFRIIFGKRNYSHVNGSNQIQLVNSIIVGEDAYHYSTHKYNNRDVYKALANNGLSVTVVGENGTILKDKDVYSVGRLEDLIYGSVTAQAAKAAQNKAYYELLKNGEQYSDLYEGIDLEYFLTKVVEIPGIKGNITFKNEAGESLVVSIEEALAKGKNPQSGVSELGATLAFAKNGAPLVFDKKSAGFEKSYTVTDGINMTVQNSGGPICLLLPATDKRAAQSLVNVTSISISLAADKYAHLAAPYATLAANKLTVSGNGTTLTAPKIFTVGELEGKQTLAQTAVYSFLNKAGTVTQARYRGIRLYDFLKSTDVGLRSNAANVIITATDGSAYTLSLAELLKNDYINSVSGNNNLSVLLAYGSAAVDNTAGEDGLPLVAGKNDVGFKASYGNDGGPLKLIVGQTNAKDNNSMKCVKNVASIEVTASSLDSWKHSVSAVYAAYKDYAFTLEVKNSNSSDSWSKTYKLSELEAMDSIIVRDDFVWVGEHSHEGLMLWAFIQQEAGKIKGIDNPSAITAFATDGYSKEVIAIWGMDEVQNGIKDSATGNRKHIILAYSQDGLPLVTSESSDGYSGLSGNAFGPIRLITHENQGACNKNVNKIVVTLNGTEKITLK